MTDYLRWKPLNHNAEKRIEAEQFFCAYYAPEEPQELMEKRVYQQSLQRQISIALLTLPERTQKMLEYIYGLNGKEQKPKSEIAKIFGLSYDRIMQIEAEARRKLRKNQILKKIKFEGTFKNLHY